jgi:hypothetical protein
VCLKLKTVIGPVSVVEQLDDRFSDQRVLALRENIMVLFGEDESCE